MQDAKHIAVNHNQTVQLDSLQPSTAIFCLVSSRKKCLTKLYAIGKSLGAVERRIKAFKYFKTV